MPLSDDRWHEVAPSAFAHEAEGLRMLRELLPDEPPFHVWTNFSFTDEHGRTHEVDALVLGRTRLHLVELKHYGGVISGNAQLWVRNGRSEKSPLELATTKAKMLGSALNRECARQAPGINVRQVVPYVATAVFLHHDRFTSTLERAEAQGLFCPPGAEHTAKLPSIGERLLEPASDRHPLISEDREQIIVALLGKLGIRHEPPRIGSWTLQTCLPQAGPGWQDWAATHTVVDGRTARVRLHSPAPGASDGEWETLRRRVSHEYAVMRRLSHDGLLLPSELLESDHGFALVYDVEADVQPLPSWLADHPQGLPLDTRVALIRQLAETLDYVHSNGLTHRQLSPASLWVRQRQGQPPRLLIADWQAAGATDGSALDGEGVTTLQTPTSRMEEGTALGDTDVALYRAPEGAWRASQQNRFKLDVFSVGAVAAYLLTGAPPAWSVPELRSLLVSSGGVDVSVALPGVSEALRQAILHATTAAPSKRTPDLGTFLAGLSEAESRDQDVDAGPVDSLEASPGQVIDGRFRLVRRLGVGSTAAGLLVEDLAAQEQRVLKVALNDAAADRLRDEAAVLHKIGRHTRLVRIIDGPLLVAGRVTLLLQYAGPETLADVLRTRPRVSLDQLQEFGDHLLEAVAVLDRRGVAHRDIKPANIAVRKMGQRNRPGLSLFDFSLSRVDIRHVTSGTPPYLDPFIESSGRTLDTAAELYAAAVVLFQMASGSLPYYGDPEAMPAAVTDEVTIPEDAFDPSLQERLAAFFRRALARDSEVRWTTPAELRQAWAAVFSAKASGETDETAQERRDAAASAAELTTPLTASGLSPNALSALESVQVPAPPGTAPGAETDRPVHTVEDFLRVSKMTLNQLRGAALDTRAELKARHTEWTRRWARVLAPEPTVVPGTALPSPLEAVDLLLGEAGLGDVQASRGLIRTVVGMSAEVEPFAVPAEVAAALGVPRSQVPQMFHELRTAWARSDRAQALLDQLTAVVLGRLEELGQVVSPVELVEAVQAALGTSAMVAGDFEDAQRIAAGLVWFVLDRVAALAREGGSEPLFMRRQGGRLRLVATDPDVLEAADDLGGVADRVLAASGSAPEEAVVAADLVAGHVSRALRDRPALPPAFVAGRRAAEVAARASSTARISAAGEWHHRDLSVVTALAEVLHGAGSARQLTAAVVRDRVRARFPEGPVVPERPALDTAVDAAGVGLAWDGEAGVYRGQAPAAHTTGFQTREATQITLPSAPLSELGAIGQRLLDSAAQRGYLVLGVPAHRLGRSRELLAARFGAEHVDLADLFLTRLRETVDRSPVSWEMALSADAAPPGTKAGRALQAWEAAALPQVVEHVESVLADTSQAGRPVFLTGVAVLTRLGPLQAVARWADLGARRSRAVWVGVPQAPGNVGPVLDGVPVPTSSRSQFVRLEPEWIDTAARLTADPAADDDLPTTSDPSPRQESPA